MKSTDVQVREAALYFLPVITRAPLKFGNEVLTSITCARVRLTVSDRNGRTRQGWGETPLSVEWAWPSRASYADRYEAMTDCCLALARAWSSYAAWGHPIEIGTCFQSELLPDVMERLNEPRATDAKLPYLAALICCSAFDLALHDAYGVMHGLPVYQTYHKAFMSRDLADLTGLQAAEGDRLRGLFPADFLSRTPRRTLPVWHLVGAADPLEESDRSGEEPDDGSPHTLAEWIGQDGVSCLKVKLSGVDLTWDVDRLRRVGRIGRRSGVKHLSADFNCMVSDPAYVLEVLDQLETHDCGTYDQILYVEQPFPRDLADDAIDVRDVARRKPLFLDESAHDWRQVRLGRDLGWNGVALKTCKTQSGALLSLCWARAHQMSLMVQDLTNPMLAQAPHVLLAAHADTIMGVESNAMQYYPAASQPEARVHPGLYARRHGELDLSTLDGPGFGYRIEEIDRALPVAAFDSGA